MAKQANANPANSMLETLSKLTFDNAEAFVRLHTDAAKHYTDLGADRFNAGLNVKTLQELQAYWLDSADTARTVVESLRDDNQAAIELGNGYVAAVQEVITAQSDLAWPKAA